MPHPHGFIERLAELSATGRPFASVMLIETVGSTPSDAGTKMLVDETGLLFGTVGGGRVEVKAISHAQSLLADADAKSCELVEWNLQRDVGMTCGGVVKLLFETYNLRDWRIVIFGAGHVAQSLVRLLLLLECRVVCVDPRAEWLSKLPQSSNLTTMQLTDPREFATSLRADDYVLCMTMGHRTDHPVLQAILERGLSLPYLGVIGSRSKQKVLMRELTEAGISPEIAKQFRCPVGLPLGTNHPGEIAVSVAAELIQVRDQLTKPQTSS